MTQPPSTIVCVECGGAAHLTSFLPEDGSLPPGTPLVYHCDDCGERFDVYWDEDSD